MSSERSLVKSEPSKPQPFVEADDLATVQEQILALKLDGREAIESLLYLIAPSEENRLPKAVVGATGDFSKQLVRRMNKASKGRMNLQLLPDPPVITDFERRDDRGVLHPWVRVVVGAIDKVTGEVKYAIKEQPRRNRHAVTIALETAEHKALESHPSYDRKLVARHIKELLRKEGLNPDGFIIAGAQGSNEWARYFARAKQVGLNGEQLRQTVRDQTGSGLSEKATAHQVAAAAAVMDETIQRAERTVIDVAPSAGPGPGSSGDLAAPVPPEREAPTLDPVLGRGGAANEDVEIRNLRETAQEYVTQLGITPDHLDRLWKAVKPNGDPTSPAAQRVRYRRLIRVLNTIAIGEPETTAVKAALEEDMVGGPAR